MKHIINRRKFLEIFSCGCCSLLLPSCATVPITDRKQLALYPESMINRQASAAYEKFRSKTKLLTNGSQLNEIINIGKKIEYSVSAFFLSQNKEDPTKDFEWDYILVDNDKIKNAWCMPGGKIAVYTGILKITKNTHALAAIMGHEIAHAVAKHSIERASRALVLNVGTQIADIASGGTLSRASRTAGVDVTGMLRTFGIDNPVGRKQETEADYLGLIFSSLAGYDIRESVKLWQRMAEKKQGKEPPIFLSTHPSSKKRIENLKGWINEVIVKYPPIKV